MVRQEKIQKLLLFFGGGGGVNCQSPQTSCYLQNKVQEYTLASENVCSGYTKFKNIPKVLTVDDKPWKLF